MRLECDCAGWLVSVSTPRPLLRSDDSVGRITYRKSPALLAELETRIGRERMDALLARFMTEPLRTTSAVLDMIDREAGVKDGQWFRSAIGQ